MNRRLIKIGVLTALLITAAGETELVSRSEFEKVQQSNQEEFRDISVTLAEIKNELSHINQDLGELKELRRTMLDRMIDIMLAGGGGFSGGVGWGGGWFSGGQWPGGTGRMGRSWMLDIKPAVLLSILCVLATQALAQQDTV